MRFISICLILIYHIQLVYSFCTGNNFKQSTCDLKFKRLTNLHTYGDCDNGKLDLLRGDSSVDFYAGSVNRNIIPSSITVPLNGNQLCNSLDVTSSVSLRNLMVSTVYEFYTTNRASMGITMSMTLPRQVNEKGEEIDVSNFCFTRVILFDDRLKKPEVTCMQRLHLDKVSGLPKVEIELFDIQLANCNNTSCHRIDDYYS